MSLRELKGKIISKKIKNLIINYVCTVINNKNEINQDLNIEDLNIILSSGNGSKKEIFSSLSIVNTKFDPNTYSKKNIDKFKELNDFIDPLDEEGINPKIFFEEISFDFVPKLGKGLKFDLSWFDFQEYKEDEEIKIYDKSILDNNNDNKYLFCIYCMKLNGKRHKFQKIIQFIEAVLDSKKEFFNIMKKVLIIFEVKSIEQIEPEYLNFPLELKETNENEDFDDFKILFNIKKEDDENTPSDIFVNSDCGKTFYFILNPNNYITKIKTLYSPSDLVQIIIGKDKDFDANSVLYKNDNLDDKIKGFYEYFEFLKNIKQVRYYFYLSYNFKLVLNYNEIEDKLFIKDIFFTRFNGEFRPTEYKKLRNLISIFKPDFVDFKEIESIDFDIDFNDMTCIKCSNKIKDDEELFYCYICKDKYCFNCVKNHLKNNSGKRKFIDPQHNLIFFKTRNASDLCGLDKYKLGNNTFVNAKEEDLGRFIKAQCDGCGSQFATSARYICVSCKPGLRNNDGYKDFCQDCIEHMMKNDQNGKDIQNQIAYLYNRDNNFFRDDNTYFYHNHNHHIYIMVPLANNNEENPYTDY